MREIITGIDDRTGEPITEKYSSLSSFCYEDGYALLGTDLGNEGVKIELVHKYEDGRAIILPPRKAKECGKWLLRTLGRVGQNLPEGLPDILEKLTKQKRVDRILKRGEKKKIKDAIKVLKKQLPRN